MIEAFFFFALISVEPPKKVCTFLLSHQIQREVTMLKLSLWLKGRKPLNELLEANKKRIEENKKVLGE